MLPATRLPVARSHDSRAGCDGEVTALSRRQPREVARISPAVERHAVTAAQRPSGFELSHVATLMDCVLGVLCVDSVPRLGSTLSNGPYRASAPRSCPHRNRRI